MGESDQKQALSKILKEIEWRLMSHPSEGVYLFASHRYIDESQIKAELRINKDSEVFAVGVDDVVILDIKIPDLVERLIRESKDEAAKLIQVRRDREEKAINEFIAKSKKQK